MCTANGRGGLGPRTRNVFRKQLGGAKNTYNYEATQFGTTGEEGGL